MNLQNFTRLGIRSNSFCSEEEYTWKAVDRKNCFVYEQFFVHGRQPVVIASSQRVQKNKELIKSVWLKLKDQ